MSTKQMGSAIPAGCAQEFLESAGNASQVGLSQWYTPRDFGKVLASMLPAFRGTIVDLNCGRGDLLYACANETTRHLFGCDIDARQSAKEEADKLPIQRIIGDITMVAPLASEAEFEADLYALNPPFNLHWHRSRLEYLGNSTCGAVRSAFKAIDPQLGEKWIDSTPATLMMALDACSYRGEGFLISNHRTLKRLILDPGAPYNALSRHIWQIVTVRGNPMTGIQDCNFEHDQDFITGVIFFSRGHEMGPDGQINAQNVAHLQDIIANRPSIRARNKGMSVSFYTQHDGCHDRWLAIREEWKTRTGQRTTEWNLWLEPDGTIGVNLTSFQNASNKINKQAAEALFKLKGQKPMQLVMQAATRAHLLESVNGGLWRVNPNLPVAVDKAMREYNAVRAPLYPLTKTQRIGYCDEASGLKCERDFIRGGVKIFRVGQFYKLKTRTINVQRNRIKPNLAGENQELLLTGQELLIELTGDDGKPHTFMDGRLVNDKTVKVMPESLYASYRSDDGESDAVEFTLQELADCFEIPDVPDIATTKPEAFQANLAALAEIENIINTSSFALQA